MLILFFNIISFFIYYVLFYNLQSCFLVMKYSVNE